MLKEKRRCELEIASQICRICLDPIKITELMYRSNSSWVRVNQYVEHLITKGMIKKENGSFKTTELGIEFQGLAELTLSIWNIVEVPQPSPFFRLIEQRRT